MQQHRDEIEQLALQVLVITFERAEMAEIYVRETDLPWPMLIDRSRGLYQAYGMYPGRWTKLMGLSSMSMYIRLMLRGRIARLPTDDVKQLGGDVIIDPSGIVQFHHVSDSPADRPSIESLLEIPKV